MFDIPNHLPIQIRRAKAEDIRKVLETWRRNHQMFGCAVMPMCKIARNKYMAEYLPTILKLIELPKLLICCDKEDEDLILGWVCFEPEFQVDEQPILHYVYTAQGVRHNGIASTLLVAAGCLEREFIWTTHYNYRIRRLLKKRKQRWKYNPYLVEVL